MTALRVETCGPGTSVQDWGREGFRRYGVSTAGAMDRVSLAHANALVGNAAGEAAVEFALVGGSFGVVGGAVLVAVSGPGAVLTIAGRRIQAGSSGHAEPGDSVIVGDVRRGMYGYLAIAGGVGGMPEMGSRSVHRRSGIGGQPLAPGDRVEVRDPVAVGRAVTAIPVPDVQDGPLRAIPGPQDAEFPADSMEALFSSPYRLLPWTDRMGCRLHGKGLVHHGGFNIVSDGVVPGSIQVLGDGQPLVLFRDCQTTGGYPKVATVISADLDRFAQIVPGSTVRFVRVGLEEAVRSAREFRRLVRRLGRISARGTAVPDDNLHAMNLIDGIVDARDADPLSCSPSE